MLKHFVTLLKLFMYSGNNLYVQDKLNTRIYKTQTNSFQYNTENDRKFSNTVRTKYGYTEEV